MSVVGVDACKRGWVAVALREGEPCTGHVVEALDELADAVADVEAVAIDIPIGLPADGPRRADLEARDLVGPRRSSVFLTPVREALVAPTHAEASATARRLTGAGVSQQAYALAPKILEAERWSADVAVPVWEVHPELSFAVMMGHPASAPKRTWTGLRERQQALARAGIDVGDIGEAGRRAAADDVLDAAAAAWSAVRLRRGDGLCLPDPPERVAGSTRPIAIWA